MALREDARMKRLGFVLVSIVLLRTVVVSLRSVHECGKWQSDYKRFLYAEMQKNSPIVYRPSMIEDIIGNRPAGCNQTRLSRNDIARFEEGTVGPNEFAGEVAGGG